jgi:protein ImuA
MTSSKEHIVSQLRQEILVLEGFKNNRANTSDIDLGPINDAFANKSFPVGGAIHEFMSSNSEDSAASYGFINVVLAPLMAAGGVTIWVGTRRTVFPAALELFGIRPDKFIFIELANERHIMWALEEALKCPALTAVVGEIEGISFTASRRLQLAVEQSRVTGFIHCTKPHKVATTASACRWKIKHLPSYTVDEIPGVGFPQWRVELMRVRNGKPGTWNLRVVGGSFGTAVRQTADAVPITTEPMQITSTALAIPPVRNIASEDELSLDQLQKIG